jgi:hypothetical protein
VRALAAVVVDDVAECAAYVGGCYCRGRFLVGWESGVDDGCIGGGMLSRGRRIRGLRRMCCRDVRERDVEVQRGNLCVVLCLDVVGEEVNPNLGITYVSAVESPSISTYC